MANISFSIYAKRVSVSVRARLVYTTGFWSWRRAAPKDTRRVVLVAENQRLCDEFLYFWKGSFLLLCPKPLDILEGGSAYRFHAVSEFGQERCKLKSHFARYGCPDQVISDNGPQFTSDNFQKFPGTWEFEHLTSILGNPKANGKVEFAVKTAKNLLRKALDSGRDPCMSILEYRNTPTQGLDSSSAQRLMNRRTKTLLPTARSLLQPRVIYPERENKLSRERQTQAELANYYNRSSRSLPELSDGDVVHISLRW